MIMNSISKNVISNLKNFLLLVFSILLMGVLCVFLYAVYPNLFHSISFGINHHIWFFRLMRWGLILAFILAWPTLVKMTGKMLNMSDEKIEYWISERLRIGAWLILFEIVVGENIFLSIIK